MARKKVIDGTPTVKSPDSEYVKVTYRYKKNKYREVMDQKTRRVVYKQVKDFEKDFHTIKVLKHEVANGNVAGAWCQRFNEKLQMDDVDNCIRIIKIEPWVEGEKEEVDTEPVVEQTPPIPDGAEDIKE